MALLRTKYAIEKLAKTLDHDQRLGAEIILRAVEAPAKQIAGNVWPECCRRGGRDSLAQERQ